MRILTFGLTLFLVTWTAVVRAESLAPPSVEDLVAEALTNNPEVRALAAGIDAARGEVITSSAWQNPEISLAPKLAHPRGGQASTELDGGYSFAQTIEFPGKRALRRALAEKNVEIRGSALKGFRTELAIQVRSAFYKALATAEVIALERRRLDLAKTFVAAARKKVDAGFAPEFEATKAEVEVVAAQKALREAEARNLSAHATLNTLVGRRPTEPLTVAGLLITDFALPDEATLLAEAEARNPGLKVQASEVERARLAVRLAYRSRLPDITIGPSYESDPDTRFYGLGLTFPLPLWNQKKGEIATAEAEERRASAELAKLRQEILRDVLTNSQELVAAKEGLSYYTPELLAKLRNALDAAGSTYGEGRTTLLVFLETQRTYFNTQADYFETLQRLYEARTAVEAAVGASLVDLGAPPDKGGLNP